MQQELTYLVDVDGVLAMFAEAVVEAVNIRLRDRGERLRSVEEITSWDISKCLDIPSEWVYQEAGLCGFCDNLKVYPGAKEGIEKLRETGHVYFVTSPIWSSRYWMYERVQWLVRNFDARASDVIQTSQKQLVRGDVLLDDKYETVVKWAEARGARRGIPALWDAPYNQKLADHPSVLRIRDWDHLVANIKFHLEEQ